MLGTRGPAGHRRVEAGGVRRRVASPRAVQCHVANDAAPERSLARVCEHPVAISRRSLALVSCSSFLLGLTPAATAASFADVFLPPEPVLFPRSKLNTKFAVLLMRSAYDALDSLDCVPMDLFQKSFWLLRQSEQESYFVQYSPLRPKVGDLADPLYFDFIAFAQWATINRVISKPSQVFEEFDEEAPNQRRVVRRDPSLADDALLPGALAERTGDAIYGGLLNGFRGEEFGAPAPLPPSSSLEELLVRLQEVVGVMVRQGYALKGEVVPLEAGRGFDLRLQGPANQWGRSMLTYRRLPLVNDYEVLVVGAYLRACGRRGFTVECTPTPTGVESRWLLA